MMGFKLPSIDISVTKTMNCVISAEEGMIKEKKEPLPCIRCSKCAEACPVELQPQDLARWPIITLAQESNLHDVIDVWFHRHNLRPRRIDVCNSLGVVASLTKAGLGISLLPPSVLRDERDRGELRLLETAPRLDDLEFQAVYPRNAETPLIKFVADMAHEVSTFGLKASERSVG